MQRSDIFQFKSQFDSARSLSLFLPDNPSFDAVATALALKISFDTVGKSVVVLCPSPMTVEFNRLVGVDTISPSFGSRNLIITFPGQTEYVDKVSYNLEKGELQLVVSPKASAPDLDFRKLKFISGAQRSDLSILIDVDRLSQLGSFYTDAKDYFTSNPLVSLTLNPPTDKYTPYQLTSATASSLSEMATELLEGLSLVPNLDTSTNLYQGLFHATQSFSSDSVTPTTFEIAAHLLKSGALRQRPLSPSNFPPGSIPQSLPNQAPSTSAGYGTDSQMPDEISPKAEASKKEPSPDWYEPKIYQGSMLP